MVSLQNSATYYDFLRTRRGSDEEWGYFQRTYGALTPSFRNVFTATFDGGPWAVTLAHRFNGRLLGYQRALDRVRAAP